MGKELRKKNGYEWRKAGDKKSRGKMKRPPPPKKKEKINIHIQRRGEDEQQQDRHLLVGYQERLINERLIGKQLQSWLQTKKQT